MAHVVESIINTQNKFMLYKTILQKRITEDSWVVSWLCGAYRACIQAKAREKEQKIGIDVDRTHDRPMLT